MRISDWSSDLCSSDLIAILYQPAKDRLQYRHQVRNAGLARVDRVEPMQNILLRGLNARIAFRDRVELSLHHRKGVQHGRHQDIVAFRDRKSTRLNSSH